MRKLMTFGIAAFALAAAGAASAQPRPYGDLDRDGVPNAYDNRNNNVGPYGDRDRDGVPNAYDNRNTNPNARPLGDRDRDGVPNAYDRRDDRWDSRWGRPVPPPRYWNQRNSWNRHVRACYAAYRTYNPRTDTYIVRRGVTARCRL